MGEILGLGCTHAPMILNPPEEWANMRQSIYSRVPGYQRPDAMVQELADDNGLSHDKKNQKRIADAFAQLRDKLHDWNPDVVTQAVVIRQLLDHSIRDWSPVE